VFVCLFFGFLDVEGLTDVARLFRDTGDGETGHANGNFVFPFSLSQILKCLFEKKKQKRTSLLFGTSWRSSHRSTNRRYKIKP